LFSLDESARPLDQIGVSKLLVTGSSCFIGSEVVAFFSGTGWEVHGMDNNMRKEFFGPPGDTSWNQERLINAYRNFQHDEVDVRDRVALRSL
jgi:CDP-paratose 2-epimerase